MNERVREIKLPAAGTTTAAGTMAVVSGWGNKRVSISQKEVPVVYTSSDFFLRSPTHYFYR